MNGQVNSRNDWDAILNECREINHGIDEVSAKVNELRSLYIKTTTFTSGDDLSKHRKRTDAVQENTTALYRSLVARMKRVKTNPESGHPRNEKQVGATERRLKLAWNDYQKAEAEYRGREKEQVRRQYLTINPDATEAELQSATEEGSGENMFQQNVSRKISRETSY